MSAKTVAVIVGRFHVPELHEGHRSLFEKAFEECDEVLVLLGTPYMTSESDPLDFTLRKMMIEGMYARRGKPLSVIESPSLPSSNEARSRILDEIIKRECAGKLPVVYGSSDSIVHKYKGIFGKRETDTITLVRGTQIRAAIEPKDSADFREGAIYAVRERETLSYPTVDVAIVSGNRGQVLLIEKEEDEGFLRFPGSFFDPKFDDSYEDTGMRCALKEVPGVSITYPQLIASKKLDDPRLKRTHDGIITMLVRSTSSTGKPTPGAGIQKALWMPMWFDNVPEFITPVHRPLAEIMRRHWAG